MELELERFIKNEKEFDGYMLRFHETQNKIFDDNEVNSKLLKSELANAIPEHQHYYPALKAEKILFVADNMKKKLNELK